MNVSDDFECTDDEHETNESNEPVIGPKPRSIHHRDLCVCCDRWKDMYLEANNRICDSCEKGPVCFGCYKGEWLELCICANCREKTPLPEISGLIINGEYTPRFYKPNIQPICDLCDEKHATVCCHDCSQVQCPDCVGTCEDCGILLCGNCTPMIWSESQCIQHGDPDYDPENDVNGDGEVGKTFTKWEDARLRHPFGHFWI